MDNFTLQDAMSYANRAISEGAQASRGGRGGGYSSMPMSQRMQGANQAFQLAKQNHQAQINQALQQGRIDAQTHDKLSEQLQAHHDKIEEGLQKANETASQKMGSLGDDSLMATWQQFNKQYTQGEATFANPDAANQYLKLSSSLYQLTSDPRLSPEDRATGMRQALGQVGNLLQFAQTSSPMVKGADGNQYTKQYVMSPAGQEHIAQNMAEQKKAQTAAQAKNDDQRIKATYETYNQGRQALLEKYKHLVSEQSKLATSGNESAAKKMQSNVDKAESALQNYDQTDQGQNIAALQAGGLPALDSLAKQRQAAMQSLSKDDQAKMAKDLSQWTFDPSSGSFTHGTDGTQVAPLKQGQSPPQGTAPQGGQPQQQAPQQPPTQAQAYQKLNPQEQAAFKAGGFGWNPATGQFVHKASGQALGQPFQQPQGQTQQQAPQQGQQPPPQPGQPAGSMPLNPGQQMPQQPSQSPPLPRNIDDLSIPQAAMLLGRNPQDLQKWSRERIMNEVQPAFQKAWQQSGSPLIRPGFGGQQTQIANADGSGGFVRPGGHGPEMINGMPAYAGEPQHGAGAGMDAEAIGSLSSGNRNRPTVEYDPNEIRDITKEETDSATSAPENYIGATQQEATADTAYLEA